MPMQVAGIFWQKTAKKPKAAWMMPHVDPICCPMYALGFLWFVKLFFLRARARVLPLEGTGMEIIPLAPGFHEETRSRAAPEPEEHGLESGNDLRRSVEQNALRLQLLLPRGTRAHGEDHAPAAEVTCESPRRAWCRKGGHRGTRAVESATQ